MVSKKVGILTLPPETNYGGIMQAVCLFESIRRLGFEPWLIVRKQKHSTLQRGALALARWLPATILRRMAKPAGALEPRGVRDRLQILGKVTLAERRAKAHIPFLNKHLPNRSQDLRSRDELKHWTEKKSVAALVVGSDQVWRIDYLPPDAAPDYFLGFSDQDTIKTISYAASFGHADWKFCEHTAALRPLLQRFHAVSVREASGQLICADVFGRPDSAHVADPTLLIEKAFFERITADVPRPDRPAILCYVLDQEAAGRLTQASLIADIWPGFPTVQIKLKDEGNPESLEAWLAAFRHARFVITDSFHGMVFSIIFEKPFIAIVNEQRGADRFVSLASKLGVTQRLARSDAATDQIRSIARNPLDYEAVRSKLDAWRADSARFLRRALTSIDD